MFRDHAETIVKFLQYSYNLWNILDNVRSHIELSGNVWKTLEHCSRAKSLENRKQFEFKILLIFKNNCN